MTLPCAAFADQKSWRDLRQLEDSVPSVRWLDAAGAATAPEPFIACGLWASREPSASDLLKRRAAAGAPSLLVARFEPADLGPVLGTPVAVQVKPGEASAVTWEDGRRYDVPGVTVLDTALAEGHWARSTAGTSVLAFRPHTQAGLIVLCTATVVGPALGTDPAAQRALLHRLLDEMELRAPQRATCAGDAASQEAATTAADYLGLHGADGALVLLAALAVPGAPVDGAALATVGAALPEERLRQLVATMPPAVPGEIELALRGAGWGAHLRTLAHRRTEAS